MIQTVNSFQFREAFRTMGRVNQFSYEGLGLLFEHLEEVNPDYELDVIALCCDFAEDTPGELIENYSIDMDGIDMDDDEAVFGRICDFLERHTILVGETGRGFVYAQF